MIDIVIFFLRPEKWLKSPLKFSFYFKKIYLFHKKHNQSKCILSKQKQKRKQRQMWRGTYRYIYFEPSTMYPVTPSPLEPPDKQTRMSLRSWHFAHPLCSFLIGKLCFAVLVKCVTLPVPPPSSDLERAVIYVFTHRVRPFSAETSPPRTLHWPRTVTPVTWPGGWRGAALLAVLQDNSQAHRVGRQHRAAEVHASQALGLPVRAPPHGPRAVPLRCVPLWAFSPGSQHNVNDALLVQVTALCEGDRITTRMSRRYTAGGAEPPSILQSTRDIGLCPSSARSPGPQSCPALATPRTIALKAPLPMEFSRQEYWSG